MAETRAQGPLAGVRILEFAGIGPAPFCCMLLADLGADVLRIDRPSGPGAGPALVAGDRVVARGRPAVVIDLKQQGGRGLVQGLLRHADAAVEGFRPGVMERLGLGPADCLALNRRLVYARVTGWGREGPLAGAPGHDLNYIAVSGALAAIGSSAQRPPAVPLNLLGDYGGGGLLMALGIVAALFEARQSDTGQIVDTAMLHGTALLMTATYGLYGAGDWSLTRRENVLDGGAPFYDVYTCADGRELTIACLERQFYAELLATIGLEGSGIDDQWDRDSWPRMRRLFTETFAARPRRHWEELFAGAEICFAPVLTMAEAPAHPQNRAAGVFDEEDGIARVAPAPRFSRTPLRSAGPEPPAAPALRATLERWGAPPWLIAEALATADHRA
jgi:alpha-methylacyl-CoA racemase